MTPAPKRVYDRTSYVLVVDDDNTLLKFFKIHLNKFFSRVIVVKNAKEAIEALRTKEIDLVISDIKMPRVDGLQLMRKVRQLDATIPVVLISGGMLSDEEAQECEANADGFLRKPFGVEDLHGIIDRGLKRREALKELQTIVGDNKGLLALLETPSHADERVKALLATLKKAG